MADFPSPFSCAMRRASSISRSARRRHFGYGVARGAGLGLLAICGGCPSSQPANQSASVQPTARPLAPRARRTATASVVTWWKEFNRRMHATGKPKTANALKAKPPRDGFAARWAQQNRQHPAFALANRLQRDGDSWSIGASAVMMAGDDARRILLASADASALGDGNWSKYFGVGRDETSDWRSSQSAASAALWRRLEHPAAPDVVMAGALPNLQNRARGRQLTALQEFLSDAAVDQNQARDEEKAALTASMRDDIERARRVSLDSLVPQLPDDPLALELTNLRLRLLSNLYKTEAERATARARLALLETQWREILRQQESERRALLARLREERPRAIETQQTREIAANIEAASARDEALRRAINRTQRAFIAVDFQNAQSRLGIVLPGDRRRSSPSTISAAPASKIIPHDRTAPLWLSSARPGDARSKATPPEALFSLAPAEASIATEKAPAARLKAMAQNDVNGWSRVLNRRAADWRKVANR